MSDGTTTQLLGDPVARVIRTHVAPVTGLEEVVARILSGSASSGSEEASGYWAAVSQTNTELTRQAFDAMNRRDIGWLIDRVHPDIEMHMVGVAGVPVTYRGADGVREYFRDMDALWESFESFPEDIHDLGDRVVVISRQRFRGRASGIDVERQAGILFVLRDDLVTEIRGYESVGDTLAAAGLE